MRIRQLKPSYYLDKALWTGLKADTREFYVALWLIADDAGWFEWDVASIGASVYAFVPVGRREKDVARHAQLLKDLDKSAPHLLIHACGHAQVPKMPQHQRLSGQTKRVTTDSDRHERGKCPVQRRPEGPPRGSPRMPADSRGGQVDESVQPDPKTVPFPQVPAGPRGSPRIPDTVGNGSGKGKGIGNARERETTTTEFQEQMAAAGLRGQR